MPEPTVTEGDRELAHKWARCGIGANCPDHVGDVNIAVHADYESRMAAEIAAHRQRGAESIVLGFQAWEEERKRAEAAEAERDALRACTTCDGQPHASGQMCICGGSGVRADETQNLRQEALALRDLIDAAIDNAPCRYDNDLCQTHGLDARPCWQERARALLGED